MSLVLKRKINKWILTVVILILALIYVYPIFLMCINAVKPFGEVVVDVIKLPSKVEWSNITYVMDKMQYGKLFLNNVEITVIGIVGIVIFSSLTAYILDRKRNRYTSFAKTIITMPMLIPFQTIMISLLKVMTTINFSGSKVGLGIHIGDLVFPWRLSFSLILWRRFQGRLMKVPILMEQTHLRHLVLLFSHF